MLGNAIFFSFRDIINDIVFYGFGKYSPYYNRADFLLKND